MKLTAQAEAIFGSSSRGDADDLSDRDILLVDSDIDTLNQRRAQLEMEGWSVATYTWKKLDRLSEQRALFVQHLKLESRILCDSDERLAKTLSAFEPKLSYAEEITLNSNLATVIQQYPSTLKGALWTADVLYVCLRNFGVLKLAQLGKFVFSFNSILDELVAANIIDQADAGSLRKLRWMKTLYRGGTTLPSESIQRVLKSVFEALPSEILITAPLSRDPRLIVFEASVLHSTAPAYHRLRNLEKIYISLEEINLSFCSDPRFIRLRRWIEDPRNYAGFAATNETNLIEAALASVRCVDDAMCASS
jgi:hypothetical protein